MQRYIFMAICLASCYTITCTDQHKQTALQVLNMYRDLDTYSYIHQHDINERQQYIVHAYLAANQRRKDLLQNNDGFTKQTIDNITIKDLIDRRIMLTACEVPPTFSCKQLGPIKETIANNPGFILAATTNLHTAAQKVIACHHWLTELQQDSHYSPQQEHKLNEARAKIHPLRNVPLKHIIHEYMHNMEIFWDTYIGTSNPPRRYPFRVHPHVIYGEAHWHALLSYRGIDNTDDVEMIESPDTTRTYSNVKPPDGKTQRRRGSCAPQLYLPRK